MIIHTKVRIHFVYLKLIHTLKKKHDEMSLRHDFNLPYIIVISLASAMGGYLFGFDFAVITGGLPFLTDQFGLNATGEGQTVASLALGCMIGCGVAGYLSDRFGRKPGLLIAAAVFAISSVLMGISPGLPAFIGARFLAGVGVGMASILSPMYIAEIAPPKLRGRMVAIYQLTIVLGIVITHFVNYSLKDVGPHAWRWMFGLGAIPSALFIAGVLFLPESPRWLMKAGFENKALKVLKKIGNESFVNKTVSDIRNSIHGAFKVPFGEIFSTQVFPLVLIGIGLAVFQQFCGINVVFNYTGKIFQSIGASRSEQLLQAIYIGLVNLAFTLVAMMLVDKIGRKPLMIAGAGSLAVLYIIIAQLLRSGSPYLSIFVLAAIGIYALSLAPITWVLISEIFPNRVRGRATSIAVISLWLAYGIVVFTFPIIAERYGDASAFWGYSVICLAGLLFVIFRIKETKGKSLEDIEHMLH
jgi:sugar porter (SP) family MFS transporter